MLEFDEPSHVYKWDGQIVPNVTRIISPLSDYSRIPDAVLEKARQEGVHIHRMVEWDCLGVLVVDTLPEWMRPYFAAWRKFVAESGFKLIASEQKIYHRTYRYAGQLDLEGTLPLLRIKRPAILDIKRSFYAGPAIGVQLAAYKAARDSETKGDARPDKRFGLKLQPNGEYRLEEFADPEDFGTFLGCLSILNWRLKHERPTTAG